jgi:large subunit ribosomal protein L10
MNRDQKSAVIDEIADQITSAEAIFAVDYRGLSVAQAAELRGRLRDADAKFRIVKNSLSERAADKAGFEDLKPMLVGPTALALVSGDAALAAKALNDVARTLNLLEFKGGILSGSVLSAEDVRSIARLPAREVLHSQLVGTIAAPLTGLARGLNALISGLAIQLGQIAEQGLVGGSGAEGETAVEGETAAESESGASPEAAKDAGEGEAEAAAEPDAAVEPEAEATAEPEAAAETEAAPEPSNESETEDAPDAAASDEKEEA